MIAVRSYSRSGPLLVLLPLIACVPDDVPGSTGTESGVESSTTGAQCRNCPYICIDGQCVECLSDADCANPTPLCLGRVCEGCSGPGQCPDTVPICSNDYCLPCSTSADCPPDYPLCASMQCTVACTADTWERSEPLELDNPLEGGVISGFVCATDPLDRFTLPIPGPAFIALELVSDSQTGNVDLALLDAGNVVIDDLTGGSGLEVIHVHLPASGSHEVQVSLAGGPAGAPFRLTYRVLPGA